MREPNRNVVKDINRQTSVEETWMPVTTNVQPP